MIAPGRILITEEDVAPRVRAMRTIAVLGIKDARDPDAPAFSVPEELQRLGKQIVGINPRIAEALGAPTIASLAELPAAVDILDVFRRSDALPGITDELLALAPEKRPRLIWFQSGIRHEESAQRLAAAGFDVVQDRCLAVYAHRYR